MQNIVIICCIHGTCTGVGHFKSGLIIWYMHDRTHQIINSFLNWPTVHHEYDILFKHSLFKEPGAPINNK